jgi:ferric-dicitrate binding protein FerR (iron transport regulator)
MQCIASKQYDELLNKLIEETLPGYKEHDSLSEIRAEEIFKTILQNGESKTPVVPMYRQPLFRRVAAVAAILILFASSYYFIKNRDQQQLAIQTTKTVGKSKDILPGTNKAVLTLADGTKLTLDSTTNGNLAKQGNTRILKVGNQLAYKVNGNDTKVLYNLISTPRGGQYQIELADGSKVWLNAASSLKFPTAFTGKERKVELTGEAYFEVAKNAKMPFKVNVNGREEVLVLGTHFNIMAYADEPAIKTTLLEGSVKIAKDKITGILTPGQQAQLTQEGELAIVDNADIDEVIAWKNGQTLFVHQDIKTIMRQVSRWYDLDVEYNGNKLPRFFTGSISRKSNLSSLLKILELSDVHFTIEGTKIIVTP